MGGEQLAGVMRVVAEDAASQSGKTINQEALNGRLDMLKLKVDQESEVWWTSGHGLDDGVIDPRDTRHVLVRRCFYSGDL